MSYYLWDQRMAWPWNWG